ncbi:UDP-N-acetylmuramoyl-L-alanyl-D-glutamate--2,6-diaminopimelate ligase [Nakamurella sp. GG22]
MPPSAPPLSLRPGASVGATVTEIADLVGARTHWADPGAPPTGSTHRELLDARLSGITLRAQDVRPGDLFAALAGSRFHGSTFAPDAIAAGAAAVLTDEDGRNALDALAEKGDPVQVPVLVTESPRRLLGRIAKVLYGDPSTDLAVVGITGTAGKTTTCYLLEAALAADGSRTGLIGTVQTRIDGQVAPSALTTPEAPDLQALFAVMLERGVSVVAMEVSSHALALGRVSGTEFAVGAFTNLSQDHLDFHTDMEDYFAAKRLLFDGRARRHVIDIDTSWGARLAADHPDALTVSVSDPTADWSVTGVEVSTTGIQHVTLNGPAGRTVTLDLAIPGAFNVANAAVAIGCVDALGRDVQQAADAIAGVVVPGRMQRVDAGQDFLAVVDYAHKPAALAAVLDAISTDLTGRLIVVVGAGGDRDTGKRPLMGAESATRADVLIVTDDNPRSEPPAEIRAQLLAGARAASGRAEILEIGDRRAAIRAAVQAAGTGDAVVIAGKGHELGQDVGGVVQPFSDRDELLAALTERADGMDRTVSVPAESGRPTTVLSVTEPAAPPRIRP